MKFHKLDGMGPLLIERVSTLPSYGSGDEGRVIYTLDTKKFYIGKDSDWEEIGGAPPSPVLTSGARASVNVQYLPVTTWTKVLFTVEEWDINNEFDPINSLFKTTNAGYYLCTGQIQSTLVPADKEVYISWWGGSTIGSIGPYSTMATGVGRGGYLTVPNNTILWADANFYLGLYAYYNNTSGTLDIGTSFSTIQIVKLG